MEQKTIKILISKSGKGNVNPRCPIPLSWFKELGFNENEVEAIIKLDKTNKKLKFILEKKDE